MIKIFFLDVFDVNLVINYNFCNSLFCFEVVMDNMKGVVFKYCNVNYGFYIG